MTSFERTVFKEIGDLKAELVDRLGRIETKLDNDGRELYGNGKPGLLDRFDDLEDRVRDIETKQSEKQKHYGAIIAAIAFLINAVIALMAYIKST